MGHIYTKKGDQGETGLLGGSRIGKDHLKVSCYGTLDEANAAMGVAYSLSKAGAVRESLREIQKKLFVVCAELACDDKGGSLLKEKIESDHIRALEQLIDRYEERLGPMKAFAVPGGTTASAAIHLARAIVRRGERLVVELDREAGVRPELLQYINRLSDALFMLAREEEQQGLAEAVKHRVLEKIGYYAGGKEGEHSLRGGKLDLETAKRMAAAAEVEADRLGIPVVFAAADDGGSIILLHRMEGALPVSMDIAPNKAFTAAALRMPTHEVAALVQPGKALYGLQWTNQGRIVPLGGGFPLEKGGRIFGAIGVSGGTIEADMAVAAQALSIFEQERGI